MHTRRRETASLDLVCGRALLCMGGEVEVVTGLLCMCSRPHREHVYARHVVLASVPRTRRATLPARWCVSPRATPRCPGSDHSRGCQPVGA